MNKQELLDLTRTERAELDEIVAHLDDDDLTTDGVIEGLSIKDMLAHIAAWERRAVDGISAWLRGEKRDWPEPGYTIAQTDELNDRDFAANRGRALDDVRHESSEQYSRMVALIESMSDDDLFSTDKPGWRGMAAAQIIRANADEHYREHIDQIAVWLEGAARMTTALSLPKAIFFDMDGTILDWQTGMEESWLASCEQHCDGSYDSPTLHDAIRTRRTWFWDDHERAATGRMDLDAASREIARLAFEDMKLGDHELAHRIADAYRARREADIVPYAGAIETLESLRQRGVKMALITNGGAISQRKSIERCQLEDYFDCIVIEGEFGCGKPDGRVFRHALASCGVAADDAWMIGDSLEADIAGALGVGMHAIWVNAHGAEASGGIVPHRTVRSIAELVR